MSEEIEKHEVSNRLYTILVVLLVGLSGFFVMQILVKYHEYTGFTPRTVTIDAVGKAYATPDIALLNVGIHAEGKDAKTVVKDGNDKFNGVLAAIKDLGVDQKDIQTTNYNIAPRYNYTADRGSTMDGYTLDQNINIKIRNFDNIGKIIEKSTGAGANLVGNLQFIVDDNEVYKTAAREDAIKKIREKAKNMEDQAGLSLGRIVSIYEYEDSQPMPYGEYKSMSAADGMGGGGIPAPSIQPGQNEINLHVTMEYQVR